MVKSGLNRNLFVTLSINLFLFAIVLGLSSSNAFAQASGTLKFHGKIIEEASCGAKLDTSRGRPPSATVSCPSHQQVRSTSLVLRNGSVSSHVADAFIEPAHPGKDTQSYSMVLSYR